MKYLVKYQYLDAYFTQSPEKIASYSAAPMAYAEQSFKSGRLKEVYMASGMKQVVMIVDISSPEEMTHLWIDSPVFSLTRMEEITPLVDLEIAAKGWKENSEKVMKQ